jgi:hypothetical protein
MLNTILESLIVVITIFISYMWGYLRGKQEVYKEWLEFSEQLKDMMKYEEKEYIAKDQTSEVL